MLYLKMLVKQLIPFAAKLGMVFIAGLMILWIGSMIVFSSASNELAIKSAREMSVTGTAKNKVSPDSASITLGKNLRGTDVADLQAQAATAINTLTAKLLETGVLSEEIRTNNYSVNPVYNDEGDITSYAINISVQVTLEKKNPEQELLTKIIVAGTESGVDEVSGLYFYLADYDLAVKELEDEAIADARATAEKRAASAGATLGRVISVSSGGYYPYYSLEGRAVATDSASAPSSDIQFSAGQFDLEANVTVTYELK
jgi:uncharacterized protein